MEVKPVRRRKKKVEPEKPWRGRERLVVFLFLVIIPLLSLTFLAKSKSQNTLFSKDKVLGEMASAPRDLNELKNELTNEMQNLNGTYGIWVQALDGSYSLGINEKEQFDGASLFKLPLMIGFYEEVEKGNINPDTNYTIKYSDASSGAGILASLPPGTVVTYHDIVAAMGKDSDNTAFSIMSNILNPNEESNVIGELGMKDTSFDQSLITPYDTGLLFYKLSNANLISGSSKKEIFDSLTNTQYEDLVPSSVPAAVRVVHKYGADDNELNDAGIIFARKPFILVILAKDMNGNEGQLEIPKMAKIVYDWAAK